MNSVCMSDGSHLAKLAAVANKQTLFLSHILYRMDWDSDSKQFIVSLTAYDKRKILTEIGCDSKNPLKLAAQYLRVLKGAGLIQYIGNGGYLVCPKSYGIHKYIEKRLRDESSAIYETRVFSEEAEGVKEFYIITRDGERIDLF